MSQLAPKTIYRCDYNPPVYRIPTVNLRFDLGDEITTVRAQMRVVRAAETPPADFTLEEVTRLRPQDNKALQGLYQSGGNFCTQCEAEGFRRMTYFLDRPDVLSVFTTTLIAEQRRYPVLLSNGNPVAQGVLPAGRHWATWHDPFPKPCYLFALIAGTFEWLEDTFITRSGRKVTLRIYVEPGHLDQSEYALFCLKQAMAWDEQRFGLEYDLDWYMIVAVSDFNMGAMENKGLNIFNTKYVLARPDLATDTDYLNILSVVGHEYFHNWTGNRVTCRDWFQLSLKEGLTVFRDQEFSSDLGSRGVKRIEDVRFLRSSQFPQDAGPMAHPVRPDSYIEINNFYTVTVYSKGAEIIRMMHTLLGEEGFRRGMDLYFQRHDGQAVTCDDFVAAMADANQTDLHQFQRWYQQSGTPELTVSDAYDPVTQCYTVTVRQSCPPTPGQPHKEPFHIPLAVGLLGADGQDLPLQLAGEAYPQGTTRVLELREPEHTFCFIHVPTRPVPSLLRGFSAPVKLLHSTENEDDLKFRLAHDRDAFNRWDAAQTLATQTILRLVMDRQTGRPWTIPESFSAAFEQALTIEEEDPALLAQVLTLPGEPWLAEQMAIVDVEGIHLTRRFVQHTLAKRLCRTLWATYHRLHQTLPRSEENGRGIHGALDTWVMGRRTLKNVCLDYVLQLDDPAGRALALRQFQTAANMTDQLGALTALINSEGPERDIALNAFYDCWKHEALVVDKWLTLHATSWLPGRLEVVQRLMTHEAFNLHNPNKVRALIGAFCQSNPVHFHAADGRGYAFLADQVLALNAFNPQIAARLVGAFSRWQHYDPVRQQAMREQLERILAVPNLSRDVYEIATKSLGR